MPLKLVVVEEVAILAGVQFIRDECQQSVIELKLAAHLVPKLVHAVEELKENLRTIIAITVRVVLTAF